MEGYARHSRSHSRAPPPVHPPNNNSYTNGGAGTGLTDYYDVFGGPSKFGVTPFAPRAEDYSEIFGSFLSTRASSIPMLDLPPVDDAVDVARSEYSDVFGSFGFADFAVHYDELFERSHAGEDSSDDAWTQVGTESPSEESDPAACSERNPYFLNGEFHQSLECNQLNVSYHKVNMGPVEDSNLTYIAQLSAVPGYSYLVNGSSCLQKEDAERYSSGVADDIILCEDSSGKICVETFQKTSSVLPHGFVGKQLHDYDRNPGLAHRAGNCYVNPTFVCDSDTSHGAEPSNLPSPPMPASLFPGRKEDSNSSASDYEVSKSCTAETTVGGGSLHFFDLELDAGSSAVASAAAMKEAMDKAKVKLKSAKELMERKKDGLKGPKPDTKNEMNGEGKVRMDPDDSSLSNDHQQKTCKREQDHFMVSGEGVQDASRTPQFSLDPMLAEHVDNGAATYANGRLTKNDSLPLDHGLTDGDGELKEATQDCELLHSCNSIVEPDLSNNGTKVAHDKTTSHFGNGNTSSLIHQEGNMEGMNAFAQENEDSKPDEERYDPRENRRRLRTTKAASRNDFHQKMLKVAQEVHETVIGDHVETEKRLQVGGRGHGIERNFEIWPEGKNTERRFDQAAQHVDNEEKHKLEANTSVSQIRQREDLAQTEYGKKETDASRLEGEGRRIKEFCVGEETLEGVKEVVEREENDNGVKEAHEIEERKEACSWKDKELRKRMVCTIDEDVILANEDPAQKEHKGLAGSTTGQESNVIYTYDEESLTRLDDLWGRVGNETNLQESHNSEHSENNIEEAVISHFYEMKLEDSVEQEENENHGLYTEDSESGDHFDSLQDEEMEKLMQESKLEKSEKICHGAPKKEQHNFNDDVQAELSSDEQDNLSEICRNVDSEFYNSFSMLDEKEIRVPDTACQCDDPKSFGTTSSHDEKDAKPNAMDCEGEKKYTAHTTQDVAVDEEKSDLKCDISVGKTDSKVPQMADLCASAEHLQKTEAAQLKMAERNENIQKRSQSFTISQGVGKDGKTVNGYLAAEDREKADGPGYLAAEDREKADGLEKQHLRTFEKEREKEREQKFEMRAKELDELRKKEHERELEVERLRKLKEKRERDTIKELEKERLRKLEEDWEREREREKDRMGIDVKASEAHERALAEARERAERAAAERATAEARQRAMAEARERLEKACAEAREKTLSEKPSVEAHLRAERAAVERATAEAHERALEKARAERTAFDARVERSSSEKISKSFREMGIRHCLSSSDLWDTDKSDGREGESAQRCKARLERHRRTVERVAKALAEKNMRDLIAQREQAERNRLAEALDVEIKRWSNGKEGNLRALLSTLQYILGSDSGWKPIPLTEVITSAAVKKAYRKATLYVHPDKLQQRGATIQKKYICEKVFDLLKDAWNKFNSEER